MELALPEIVPCPSPLRSAALSLVLCDITPGQRREIVAAQTANIDVATQLAGDGLFVAMRGEQVCGAAWGQLQPGNTAIFWPPQLEPGEDAQIAHWLAKSVLAELDRVDIGMTQVILPSSETACVPLIEAVGFRHLANLLYLSWEAQQFPAASVTGELQFVPYDDSLATELRALVERTYEGALDCPALNGARPIDEVLQGYRSTGEYHAENWQIARHDGHNIGALILADHPRARHWELVYMGLVPEVRGRGWGKLLTGHAQWLASRAQVERIVLAVDAINEPALRMYHTCGFQAWDRRTVFVRFFDATSRDRSNRT